MMIQLKKCLGYLKSVKLLFTFLGISCFILLGNSFVNAGAIYQVGTHQYLSPYDSTIRFSVINKSSFISNRIGTAKRVLAPISKTYRNSNDGEYMYMWWYNGLPYFYANYWSNLDNQSYAYDNLYQGQPTTYFVCPGVLTGDSGDSFNITRSQCSGVPVGVGTPNALKSFLNTVNSNDMFYINYFLTQNYGRPYQRLDFCVSSLELGDTVCFRGGCSPRQSDSSCIELNNSFNLYRHMQFEEISDYIISDSPAIDDNMGSDENYSGGLVENTDAIYVYHGSGYRTRQDMMNAYLANGYYTGLCYGNFSLDNILEIGDTSNCQGVNRGYCVFASVFENQDCDDGQSYCGANIFELAHQYNYTGFVANPGLRVQNLYAKFTTNFNYGFGGDFVGKSKGLFYLPYKLYIDIQNGFLKASGEDYINFCDMVINGYDPNEYYNGPTSDFVDEYFDSSDINIILSGANEDFTGASDFFSLFNKFYSNAKNTFKLDNTGATGILPTYIIFGFLLFLLLYGLKR